MIKLGVNIDHAATLRQARYRDYPRHRGEMVEPDPIAYALAAEQAGADGITVHPREDARHIQLADVLDLKAALQVPLNMEMACTDAMVTFALKVAPRTVCLVPEKREEISTEGGLDLVGGKARIKEVVKNCLNAGIATSLFIDPEAVQIELAAEWGSPFIELHTGAFANAWYKEVEREREWQRLISASELAQSLGIQVNLGHGINYTNIQQVRTIPGIHEMNIGHSILSRSLFTGVREAVREMKLRMNSEDHGL